MFVGVRFQFVKSAGSFLFTASFSIEMRLLRYFHLLRAVKRDLWFVGWGLRQICVFVAGGRKRISLLFTCRDGDVAVPRL